MIHQRRQLIHSLTRDIDEKRDIPQQKMGKNLKKTGTEVLTQN
jgi:hypothetical protein